MAITKEEAIALYDAHAWKEWTPRVRAEFQLIEDRLCMPFQVFHESIEEVLGRPVYTHEFATNRQGLIDELLHGGEAPTLTDIVGMLPQDKRIIVVAQEA